MGRPTKYKKEYGQLFIDIMEECGIEAVFCARVGISDDTLRNWKKKHADFLGDCKRGKAIAKANFLIKLNDAAWDAESNRVNNGLIHMLAINCHGLRTKDEQKEESQDDIKPLKVIIERQDGRK